MLDTAAAIGIVLGVAAIWIPPIILGVREAKAKQRSSAWMWFGVHPIGGWIAYGVLRSLPALRECPQCAEKVKAHAKMCPYCMTPFTPKTTDGLPT